MSYLSCSLEDVHNVLDKVGSLADSEVLCLAELMDAADAGLLPKNPMYRKCIVVAERELMRRLSAESSILVYERTPGALSDLRERALKRLERAYGGRASDYAEFSTLAAAG
jgi:hypothetical protein